MKANVLIDWLSFSVKCQGWEDRGEKHSSSLADARYVCESVLKLPMDRFTEMPFGRYGYKSRLAWNGIEILFDGHGLDMGLCVSMSGNACRVYELENSLLDLCKRIQDNEGINPTRIDLACDDKQGRLNVSTVIDAIRAGELRSRIRKKTGYFDISEEGKEEADSVYIGSNTSELRFRIYDKAKEQGDYKGVWNRLEMVCRRDYAASAIYNLVHSGLELGPCVAGMIADRLEFIVRDDTNISRCSLQEWWKDFLEALAKVRLMLKEKPKMAVARLAAFLDNEMSAIFWTCVQVYGEKFLELLMESGKKKAGKRHQQMIDDYIIDLDVQLVNV